MRAVQAAERLRCVSGVRGVQAYGLPYDNAQAGIVAVPHGALRNAGVYECICVVCGAYDRRPHAQ